MVLCRKFTEPRALQDQGKYKDILIFWLISEALTDPQKDPQKIVGSLWECKSFRII